MTSKTKALNFATLAKEHGWTGSFETDEENDYAKIIAKRKDEELEIEWVNNQLAAPPKYRFAGTEANLHSAAVAKRTVMGAPDMRVAQMRRRRAQRTARTAQQQNSSNGAEVQLEVKQFELPFDVIESPNREVLLACRGNRVVYLNRITHMAEMVFIPKEKNRNWNKLHPVYYMTTASSGRRIINFIEDSGMFRAIALDTILQVR